MKRYSPDTKQFRIIDNSILKAPSEELEGYIPKTYVKYNPNLKALTEASREDFEYILKFSLGIPSGAENEHFFLWLSKQCDIKTSNAYIIKDEVIIDGTSYDNFMLLSENFLTEETNILHLKDILESEERKKGVKLPRIYAIIDELSNLTNEKKEDIKLEVFKQVLYSNTIGNYDLNYGNMAFLTNSNYKVIDIAPAYDLTSTYLFDSSTKSNIIINGKNKDVTAEDIINDTLPYINKELLYDTVANITFKINDNFDEIKNSYMQDANALKDIIYAKDGLYIEDDNKDDEITLMYKHIKNKIHSLSKICNKNQYIDLNQLNRYQVSIEEKAYKSLEKTAIKDFKEMTNQNNFIQATYDKSTIYYHGTFENFENFKNDATWFTDSEDLAKSFGDRVIKVQVDLYNPLNLRSENERVKILKEVLKDKLESSIRTLDTLRQKYTNQVFIPDDEYFTDNNIYRVNKELKNCSNEDSQSFSNSIQIIKSVSIGSEKAIYQFWDKIVDYAKQNGYDGILSIEEPRSQKLGIDNANGVVAFYADQIKVINPTEITVENELEYDRFHFER